MLKSDKNTTYVYSAGGEKLRRIVGSDATEYINGIQYTNGTLDFVQTEEGRAIPNGSTAFNYEYTLSDHLGNSRVSFSTASGTAVLAQTNNYYPFGMETPGNTVVSPKNNYLYNKKELQENIGVYDYGARFYDPVIGRWSTVDPLADEFDHVSPYNYAMNNPVLMIDEFGMAADTTKKVNPTPKPEPKPIELKEVEVKGKTVIKSWSGTYVIDRVATQKDLNIRSAQLEWFTKRFIPLGRTLSSIVAVLNVLEMTNNMSQSNKDKSDELPDGFKETKEFGKPHGQKVYKKGNKFYSKDSDGHSGGAWRVFEKQGTKLKRVGTADKDLNFFKK